MRRFLLVLMSVLLVFLCSCELSMTAPKPGKVHILVYGNDYWFLENSKNWLNSTVNDAVQVGIALTKLCEKANMAYDATFIYGENTLFDS